MSHDISVDFVTYCENFRRQDTLSCPDDDLPWRCPCLQVMDIQLYGGSQGVAPLPSGSCLSHAPDVDKHTRRYYVLLHDTRKVMWAIAPPGGAFASLIADGAIEIGSLVTLGEYAIVEAANGKRVVVVLAATCNVAMPFSLIGQPFVDGALYHLSRNSLLARQQAMLQEEKERERRQRHTHPDGTALTTQMLLQQQQQEALALAKMNKVLLDTLWAHYAQLTTFDAINTWHVYVRVLWKSKLRRIVGSGGGHEATQKSQRGGGGAGADETQGRAYGSGGGGGGKYVFDAIVCDEAGDAVKAVFFGRKAFETLQQGQYYRIGGGSVHLESRVVKSDGRKRRRNEFGEIPDEDEAETELVPIFVQFHDKTWIEEDSEAANAGEAAPIPNRPYRLLSGAEEEFLEVRDVLHKSSIGDLVSFRGIISKCSQITEVQTRTGRVDKLSLTVKDRAGAEAVDVTLWGSVAQSLAPFLPMRLGTSWCFRDVTVRMYGNLKVISSRSSSEVLLMSALTHITPVANAKPRQGQQEVSLTFAGTQFQGRVSERLGGGMQNNDAPLPTTNAPQPSASSSAQQQQQQGAGGKSTLEDDSFPFQVSLTKLLSPSRRSVGAPTPFLLKIAHIEGPFAVPSCRGCGRRADPGTGTPSSGNASNANTQYRGSNNGTPSFANAGGATASPTAHTAPFRCTACGKIAPNGTELRFAIPLTLTDGVSSIDATAFGEAASSLCGEDIQSFAANCSAHGETNYTNDLCANLMCLPVLVSLTRIGGGAPNAAGGGAEEPSFHVTVLQHVDMGACAQVMGAMISAFDES